MTKLTKRQIKERDRFQAYMDGVPFKENARDKDPQIPTYTTEEMLDSYVPLYVTESGKHFTPRIMAQAMWDNVLQMAPAADAKILEPCAGIGNLLQPPYEMQYDLSAIEMDDEAHSLGSKLFPDATWYHTNAFEMWEHLQGQFDIVLMNPPFNIKWGTGAGDDMVQGRCTKSEHMFFELAIRAAKPEGLIAVIAPYNYTTKPPKKFKEWMSDYISEIHDLGQLPGEFQFTKITVHGYLIERNKITFETKEPKVEALEDVEDDQEVETIMISQATPEPKTNPESSSPTTSQSVLQEEHNLHIVEIPVDVYESLEYALNDGAPMEGPTVLSKWLRTHKHRVAATWVKNHVYDYGLGYWNGFIADGKDPLMMESVD